jgi:hypothetical protein
MRKLGKVGREEYIIFWHRRDKNRVTTKPSNNSSQKQARVFYPTIDMV